MEVARFRIIQHLLQKAVKALFGGELRCIDAHVVPIDLPGKFNNLFLQKIRLINYNDYNISRRSLNAIFNI